MKSFVTRNLAFGLMAGVALMLATGCSNTVENARNAKSDAASDKSKAQDDSNAAQADASFQLNVPEKVRVEMADGEVPPADMEVVKEMLAEKQRGERNNVKVTCKGEETEKVFGFLHLEVRPQAGSEPVASQTVEVNEGEAISLNNAQGAQGTQDKPIRMPAQIGSEWTSRPGWMYVPGLFVPLRCKGPLSVELRYLKEGVSYDLTGHFFSVKQRLLYEGSSSFAYPVKEGESVVLKMERVEDGHADVSVIFADDPTVADQSTVGSDGSIGTVNVGRPGRREWKRRPGKKILMNDARPYVGSNQPDPSASPSVSADSDE